MNSDSEDCTTDDIYPFVLTDKANDAFCDGLNKPMLGTGDCNSCYWLCFPCTIAIDIVTLVPFAGIYLGKKCSKKCCKKDSVIPSVTPIATQPAKMRTPI